MFVSHMQPLLLCAESANIIDCSFASRCGFVTGQPAHLLNSILVSPYLYRPVWISDFVVVNLWPYELVGIWTCQPWTCGFMCCRTSELVDSSIYFELFVMVIVIYVMSVMDIVIYVMHVMDIVDGPYNNLLTVNISTMVAFYNEFHACFRC
jgi:hypothetical protein